MFFVPSGLGLMIAGTSELEDDTTSLLTMLCITEVTSNFPAELGLAATTEPKFEKPIPDINEYWDLEKIGITDDPIVNEDDVAYDKFQRTVTFDEGRYQVQLPWIDEKKSVLPTNYEVAYDRFRSLNKRLQKNPELLQGYRDILELQHERGIIEKVPTEEIETSNAVHYLPHHPVVKPSSATTKIRIVFDAAAKRNRDSPSLNECLLRGPVILPDLCQMLMRMRTCKTVVISDIEKAFLQVGLQPIDRDVTRFLWFKDAENPRLQDNVEVWRYGRVNFGVICSPFLLAATLDHHLSQENTDFAESLRKDIYVDNVISGLNGDDDPVEYYHELKALFNRAGMNIQEFCSNSHELMTSIPERDRVKAADVKVLGLKWDSANHDSLRLVPSSKIRDAVNADAVTKRLILQALASIFDPLGWFQPALFPAKMLLHRLWDLKLGWDDPVNDELRKEWEALRASFSKIFDHRLKRCVGQDAADSTLAVFSDASEPGGLQYQRDADRGDLISCKQWWHGPAWLSRNRDRWPTTNHKSVTDTELKDIQAEVKSVHQVLAVTEVPDPTRFLGIKAEDFSSLRRLQDVSAICVKFLKQRLWDRLSAETKGRFPAIQSLFGMFSDGMPIESREYEAVELCLVKTVQLNHFQSIFDNLHDQHEERAPIVRQLGLSLDANGLLRTEGRFEHADLPESAKAPLLLPKRDTVVNLIIHDVHSRIMHCGVSHTLSRIRQRYWVVHGRAAVRSQLRKCIVCRHYKTGKPFKLSPMPPWPRERVGRAAPFQFVGLDYFGPINITVYGRTVKMWSCLFTCLVTRAIHLEPVADCSAQEFLNCLIRFVSRRGTPAQIISDNAGQFHLTKILGDQAWKRAPTDEGVTSYSATNGITWKFITELAPWQGGFYERMVGLVKTALKTTIKRRLLRWTDFVTLLTETEAVVNSRPITHVTDDVNSRLRVLRPCDFILDRPTALSDSPNGDEVLARTFGEAGKFLAAQWKRRCRAIEQLWRVWYEDYLTSLRERYQVTHRSGRGAIVRSPSVDQIVLVTDSDAPRGRWKIARVTQVIESADGRVRSATVLLPSGVTLRRPKRNLDSSPL